VDRSVVRISVASVRSECDDRIRADSLYEADQRRDGTLIIWGERTGPLQGHDRYPGARVRESRCTDQVHGCPGRDVPCQRARDKAHVVGVGRDGEQYPARPGGEARGTSSQILPRLLGQLFQVVESLDVVEDEVTASAFLLSWALCGDELFGLGGRETAQPDEAVAAHGRRSIDEYDDVEIVRVQRLEEQRDIVHDHEIAAFACLLR
jgi:hypothetical protein